ncbi:four helix bundle protein [Tunicatimonas pelagia]|uniref:four helix bundle protein n=1 Tax=Tunicatimonas pelagia TaxID=931531 RepID=UPI002665DDD2|nr:four helix bundle protein [Tunicatimonas pelagia]WKN44713.1 four helix bundle protein [Tunicatimonas pelagia]
MAAIRKFEDLQCWQKSRQLSMLIYETTRKELFARDFSLKDQILRSSGSVMDNIAEGFGRGGNKEFVQFLFYAKGSCLEVMSQLYRAKDRTYITEQEFSELYQFANEISGMIQSLVHYLKKSELKGIKYK